MNRSSGSPWTMCRTPTSFGCFTRRWSWARASGEHRSTQPTTPATKGVRSARSSSQAVSSRLCRAWTATQTSKPAALMGGSRSAGRKSRLKTRMRSSIQPYSRASYFQKCWCESMRVVTGSSVPPRPAPAPARPPRPRRPGLEVKDVLHRRPELPRPGPRRRLLEGLHQLLPLGAARMRRDVGGEAALKIEARLRVHHHHQPPLELVDVHAPYAHAEQAVADLRPDLAMVPAIGGDAPRVVLEVERHHVPGHAGGRISCRDSPRPSIPSSTTSPGLR